jgi:hypothetical protein
MALPKPLDATKIQHLQDILDKCSAEEVGDFPMPTKDDFALIGALVVIYSYIDFNFMRIIRVMDEADQLPEKHKGKIAKLTMPEVVEVVGGGDWSQKNLQALAQIAELRLVRNLMAHFTVRRFPQHEAYFLATRDARDFKQIFGRLPENGAALTAIVEVEQVRNAVKEAERLVAWFSKAAAGYEAQWIGLKPNV